MSSYISSFFSTAVSTVNYVIDKGPAFIGNIRDKAGDILLNQALPRAVAISSRVNSFAANYLPASYANFAGPTAVAGLSLASGFAAITLNRNAKQASLIDITWVANRVFGVALSLISGSLAFSAMSIAFGVGAPAYVVSGVWTAVTVVAPG